MNLKNFLILSFCFVSIVQTNDIIHHVKKLVKIKPAYYCIDGLLDTYGFLGHRFPKREKLIMCPSVDLSCCRVTDQVQMYQNWIIAEERKKMEHRFDFYKRVYNSVIDTSIDVYDRAEFLSDLLKDKDLGNCIILSKKIQHFKIKKIKSMLVSIIESYQDFFLAIHNGFYCAMCDSESHHYINIKFRTIRYTHDTCRIISKNTLKFLLYFEIHFIKFINLMQRFLTSCNYKGKFTKAGIPVNRRFYINGDQYKLLKRCQLFINTKHWYKHCRKICENFNLVKFSPYFTPKLRKYVNFINFAKSKLAKLEKDTRRYVFKIPTTIFKNKKRILQEIQPVIDPTQKQNTKKKTKIAKKAKVAYDLPEHKRFYFDLRMYSFPELFKSGAATFVKIDNFKSKFNKPVKIRYKPFKKGLDIMSYSSQTIIDKSNYEQILNVHKDNEDLKFMMNPDEYYDKIRKKNMGYTDRALSNSTNLINTIIMGIILLINN